MSQTLTIRVPGEPVPQPRVKARKSGEHATVYTPTTANVWKDLVSHFAVKAMPVCGWVKPDSKTPLQVVIDLHLRRPSTHRKRERYKRTYPDNDNYEKAIFDALVWAGVMQDDGQIAVNTTRKLIDDDWQGAVITVNLARFVEAY